MDKFLFLFYFVFNFTSGFVNKKDKNFYFVANIVVTLTHTSNTNLKKNFNPLKIN